MLSEGGRWASGYTGHTMSKHHAQHTSEAHTSNSSNEQTGTDYAASRERAAYAKSALGAFEASLDFPLDDFQRQACAAVEADRSVLVAAPTGAGKTIVGEFGIYLALRRGMKAFYTTPIKALSNQKYHDFVRAYGEDYVGLLTGDTSINTEAPVVVMTTEVLRNMLYANSTTLTAWAMWSWMRCTTWRTVSVARCGKRRLFTFPST